MPRTASLAAACLLGALLGSAPARANDPTLSLDATTGLGTTGAFDLWGGLGVQAHVPVQGGAFFHLGGRVQYTAGFRTSFLSFSPMIAIKGEVLPDFSLFVDLSGSAAVELVDPGIAPHGRVALGGYYRNQGFFLYGEVFGPRGWRTTQGVVGFGYASDFL